MHKINVLSENKLFTEQIKKIPNFDINIISMNEVYDTDTDYIIIFTNSISINTIISNKNNLVRCFIIAKDEDTYIKLLKIDSDILKLKKCEIICYKGYLDRLINDILQKLENNNFNQNVYTFFGCDSKVGCTSIVQGIAENISQKNKDISIIVLFLDGQEGFDWVKDDTADKSLFKIKAAIKNNILTVEYLKKNCLNINKNLYLLKGEINFKEVVFYHEDEIISLINFCSVNFDLVIIDAGNINNIQYRMTYASLISTKNRILITDQSPKSIKLFKKCIQQILNPLKINDFKFIILNKYIKYSCLLKKENIINEYDMPIISMIPFVDNCDQAMSDKNVTIFNKDKKYKKQINNIISYIMHRLKDKDIIITNKHKYKLFRR